MLEHLSEYKQAEQLRKEAQLKYEAIFEKYSNYVK